jgi:hypothetical protein
VVKFAEKMLVSLVRGPFNLKPISLIRLLPRALGAIQCTASGLPSCAVRSFFSAAQHAVIALV